MPIGAHEVYVSDWPTFNRAVYEASAGDTIIVDRPCTLSANRTVTSDYSLVFEKAGVITLGAYVLTIECSILAGNHQIFDCSSGSGWVVITQGPVNVCWWGAIADNSTDCQPAFQSAAATGKDVYIPGNGSRFRIYSTVTLDTFEQRIFGDSPNKSIINATVGSADAFIVNANKVHIEQLKMRNAISGYAHIKVNTGMDFTLIERCVLQDAEYLVQDEGNLTCIKNCEFEDYGTYGIYQPDGIGGGQLSVENCYFKHSSPSSGQAHARVFAHGSQFSKCTFGNCYDCIILSESGYGQEYYQTINLIGCWCEEASNYEITMISDTYIAKLINVVGGRWLGNFHSLTNCHWTLQNVRFPIASGDTQSADDPEGSTWVFINCHGCLDGAGFSFSDGSGEKIFIGKNDVGFDTRSISGTENSLSAVYDFSDDGGAVGDIALAEIPKGCRVISGQYEVLTALTSSGSATVSFGIDTDDATGLLLATPYDHEDFDTGKSHEFIPDGQSNTFTAVTTATREVIMSIGTAALTAGKLRATIRYKKMV